MNKIYAEKYVETESYHHLREIMNEYKKVNLNLIMLNMALIVDNDNEFSWSKGKGEGEGKKGDFIFFNYFYDI